MFSIYTIITFISWFILWAVWLPGYFTGKKTIQRPNKVSSYLAYAFIILGFVFLFANKKVFGVPYSQITPHTTALGIIGMIVDLLAVAFAIWARITLGSNWANMIALKENHQLIQSGPYAIVRHPIYTGFVFATLGISITIGRLTDYLGVFIMLIGMLIRIKDEDALMAKEFTIEHADYRKKTKKLIPFIW